MNTIAQAIASSQNLNALASALNAFIGDDSATLEELVDMTSLPTFSVDAPADTAGIYSYDDSHLLVQSAGEGFEIIPREIKYLIYQGNYCAQGAAEPFATLDEARHAMNGLQKNLGWTDLEIRRHETINGAIHSSTVAWGLDAGDLCIMATVSQCGAISIAGAASTESWADVREIADKVEFVQHLHGWENYAAHYQVWAHGNPEPLNYLVTEADETDE